MKTAEFLRLVVTGKEGWFCLPVAPKSGPEWHEEWFRWPEDIDKIAARAQEACLDYNVYFSSYLFSDRSSVKSNVLPTRTIQADLDEANTLSLPLVPSLLVESSPGRHQGCWLLEEPLDLETHEILSRKLTYAIPHCDHSGWPLGRKLRPAGTLNHKYLDGPHPIKVISAAMQPYTPSDLELLPEVPYAPMDTYDETFIDNPPQMDMGPQELLNFVKDKLPAKVVLQYNTPAKDRSAALWALMCSCFRAGLSRDQVFHLSKHTPNNKFAHLHYHGDRELAKDVLRSEHVVRSKMPDARSTIMESRRLPGLTAERNQYMLGQVINFMRNSGEFVRTQDDSTWYIRRDLGRPILITQRSEYLNMILDMQFGLNSTELDTKFIVAGLVAFGRSLPISGISSSLSFYNASTQTLLLHTGKKDVLRITPTAIERVVDGSYGVIFPWMPTSDPFQPSFDPLPSSLTWQELMFGDSAENAIGITRDEVLALLRVWFLFLLFRAEAISRPILALFGQPGAGKSTLFRRVYALLYGKQRSLGAVTSAEDYDYAVSADPLVVLDNVDTWERWLPDRLALSASTSDITKRKLYTDADVVVLRRQALVGITAHNPRFGREDVTDRLILINFERLQRFIPEGDIIANLLRHRDQMWGAIAQDVQRVLASPIPKHSEVPQFRVEDFARIGFWCARALGIEEPFQSAITTVKAGQKAFTLDEEHILVDAIQSFLRKTKDPTAWRSSGLLWGELEMVSADPMAFKRSYRNAVHLGKKLWALQDALRATFDVEWKLDPERNTRVWRFVSKNGLYKADLAGKEVKIDA